MILELGNYLAGPQAGRYLAEYGARVIKVELLTGDPFRALGSGMNAISQLAGKESISLDLKTPFGQQVLEKLIRRSDVIFHNYQPSVLASLKIDPATVCAINPNIVYLSAWSYGGDRPLGGPSRVRSGAVRDHRLRHATGRGRAAALPRGFHRLRRGWGF